MFTVISNLIITQIQLPMTTKNTNSGLTLTKAAFIARQAIKFSAVAVVLIIVGQMLFNSFRAYWKATHPAPPPPPTVGFGVLPAPKFKVDPKLKAKTPKSYKLETATGTLGRFPGQLNVYLMPKKTPGLLTHEEAIKFAKRFGFVFEPEVIDETHYRFIKPGKLTKILDLETVNLTYNYKTDYLDKPELMLEAKDLPVKYEAVDVVKTFLKRGGRLNRDIATASGEINYLKVVGNSLEPALAASDADLVSVSLNRVPINGRYPTYTQEGTRGIIYALISGYGRGDDRLVKVRNAYYPVDYLSYETYPLKSVKEAWNLLISGHGHVASNRSPNDQVVVREVELGYYDDLNGADYLQPIYVFKGDGEFIGLVPAVDSRYLSQEKKVLK